MADETRQSPPDTHAEEGGDDAEAQTGQDVAADQGISKEQDERYVIELASLLVHDPEFERQIKDRAHTKSFRQGMRDLRTAVAFLEAHG